MLALSGNEAKHARDGWHGWHHATLMCVHEVLHCTCGSVDGKLCVSLLTLGTTLVGWNVWMHWKVTWAVSTRLAGMQPGPCLSAGATIDMFDSGTAKEVRLDLQVDCFVNIRYRFELEGAAVLMLKEGWR